MKLHAHTRLCVYVCVRERNRERESEKNILHIFYTSRNFSFLSGNQTLYVGKYYLSVMINPYIPKHISFYHSRMALRNR